MFIISFLFLIFQSLSFSKDSFNAYFKSENINTVTTTDPINYTVITVLDIGGKWFYWGIKDRMK